MPGTPPARGEAEYQFLSPEQLAKDDVVDQLATLGEVVVRRRRDARTSAQRIRTSVATTD